MYKIKTISQIGFMCPTQFEGNLENGDYIYIRYRWGNLSMEVNDKIVYNENYGDDGYAGVISLEEVLEQIEDLVMTDEVEWVTPEEVDYE